MRTKTNDIHIKTLDSIEILSDFVNDIINDINSNDRIQILKQYGEGFSGAGVYKVLLDSSFHTGHAVLKIVDLEETDNGIPLQSKIVRKIPDFAKDHCPNIFWFKKYGSIVVQFMELAGNSSIDIKLLKDINNVIERKRILKKVSKTLVRTFQNEQANSRTTSLPGYFNLILGHKLIQEESGVYDFIRDICDRNPEVDGFMIDRYSYPNPLRLLTDEDNFKGVGNLVFSVGNLHGDLHEQNIYYLPKGKNSFDYYIIDYEKYREDTFLYFDHAYLELDQLFRIKENLAISEWLSLLNATKHHLFQNTEPISVREGQVEAIDICKAIWNPVIQKFGASPRLPEEDQNTQVICAKIAAGLNYCSKRKISSRRRLLALTYACFFTDILCRRLSIKPKVESVQTLSLKAVLDNSITKTLNETDDSKVEREKEEYSESEWRSLFQKAKSFNANLYKFGFITMPEEIFKSDNLQSIGLIDWAVLLDFDRSKNDCSPSVRINSVLEERKSSHELLPKDSDRLKEINLEESVIWARVDGLEEFKDTLLDKLADWRQKNVPFVRKITNSFGRILLDNELYLLCFLPKDGLSEKTLKVIETVQDDLNERMVLLLFGDTPKSLLPSTLTDRINFVYVKCSLNSFISGVREYFESTNMRESLVQVPKLVKNNEDNQEGNTITHELNKKDVRWIQEDMEIVYPDIVLDVWDPSRQLIIDFWRGYEISWQDLDINADVQRKIHNNLFIELERSISKRDSTLKTLYHNPGAGGTTLSKRIAWDMKGIAPTVIIKRYSETLLEKLQFLFTETGIPIFIVVEASTMSFSERDKILKELNEANVKYVILYVLRTTERSFPDQHFGLVDPFVMEEYVAFCKKFSSVHPERSWIPKKQLLQSDAYRSPFFFGLFSYQDEYIKLPEYIDHYVDKIKSKLEKDFLVLIAIITKYSQSYLPTFLMKKLLQVSSSDNSFALSEELERLLKIEKNGVQVSHYRLANQILIKENQGSSENDFLNSRFRHSLIDFLDRVKEIYSEKNLDPSMDENLVKFVRQVFITRDPLTDGTKRTRFSDLVEAIKTFEARKQLFDKITEVFPNEPHFWNHKGRLYMHEGSLNYQIAEEHVKTAISLETNDYIHHHTLGMVYRYEVKRILERLISENYHADEEHKVDAYYAYDSIIDLFNDSVQSFNRSLEIDPQNEHSFIAMIHLIIDCVNKIKRLSGKASLEDFLASDDKVTKWVHDIVVLADDLLRKVKENQGQHQEVSAYAADCEMKMHSMIGNYDLLIEGLIGKLKKAKSATEEGELNSSLASAYYVSKGRNWERLNQFELERIRDLAYSNHWKGLATDYDYWMWINSSMRLPDFDLLEAIVTLKEWGEMGENSEPFYYLYTFHFLLLTQGAVNDNSIVMENIGKCRSLNRNRSQRTSSNLWLSDSPVWCPLVHKGKLNGWNPSIRFWNNTGPLTRIKGTIYQVTNAQSGKIKVFNTDAFFVPGAKFTQRDANQNVDCYIGFSYDGLRAWDVKSVQ